MLMHLMNFSKIMLAKLQVNMTLCRHFLQIN